MSKLSQRERLYKYMQEHDGITQFIALEELGIMRLSARIADLWRAGIPVKRETVEIVNRYNEKIRVAKYSLIK